MKYVTVFYWLLRIKTTRNYSMDLKIVFLSRLSNLTTEHSGANRRCIKWHKDENYYSLILNQYKINLGISTLYSWTTHAIKQFALQSLISLPQNIKTKFSLPASFHYFLLFFSVNAELFWTLLGFKRRILRKSSIRKPTPVTKMPF